MIVEPFVIDGWKFERSETEVSITPVSEPRLWRRRLNIPVDVWLKAWGSLVSTEEGFGEFEVTT